MSEEHRTVYLLRRSDGLYRGVKPWKWGDIRQAKVFPQRNGATAAANGNTRPVYCRTDVVGVTVVPFHLVPVEAL